jgi:hypothetical protein
MSSEESAEKDDQRWWIGFKGLNDVSEIAREHRPDDAEKSAVALSKAPQTEE